MTPSMSERIDFAIGRRFYPFLGPSPEATPASGFSGLFVAREDFQQLDVEDQHARGHARAGRGIAIGQLARDPEARLVADHHALQTFGPSFDDAVQAKL